MKQLLLYLLLCAPAAVRAQLGADCNPRLNEDEIRFFDSIFSAERYEFRGKLVGFARYAGFSPFLVRVSKKSHFSEPGDNPRVEYVRRLLVLDKKPGVTGQYDALVAWVPRKKLHKVDTGVLNRSLNRGLPYWVSNYPENVDRVGTDTSEVLNDEEARFLGDLYRATAGGYDFRGKKMVCVDVYPQAVCSKRQYIGKVREELTNNCIYQVDLLHFLTLEEKLQSGGYDIVIQSNDKKTHTTPVVLQALMRVKQGVPMASGKK